MYLLKLLKLFLFLPILTASMMLKAQTSEGYIQLRGLGQTSCGEYVKWVDLGNSTQVALVGQWVWGFMTGYQMRGSFNKNAVIQKHGNISTPDLDTTYLYLKKYCSNNPLQNVANGSIEMIRELGGVVAGK